MEGAGDVNMLAASLSPWEESTSAFVERLSWRAETPGAFNEDRCKRSNDVKPLAEMLSPFVERLRERREDGCKRFVDVKPLAPMLLE